MIASTVIAQILSWLSIAIKYAVCIHLEAPGPPGPGVVCTRSYALHFLYTMQTCTAAMQTCSGSRAQHFVEDLVVGNASVWKG
jgi:hypothetical protein